MKNLAATETYPNVFLYRRLVQAKLFMDAHYAERINVDNIADEAYCSKFHFIRLFKKIYGKTPHQYLTFVRIEQAKTLLKSNQQIIDVCIAVGFESISSFKGLFKKIVGIPPAAYRVREHNRLQAIASKPIQYIPGCFVVKSGIIKE